jgi:riboflavin biosynthesis pyrimidine reductase
MPDDFNLSSTDTIILYLPLLVRFALEFFGARTSVDELWVLVTPVLIGGGKTLVDAITQRHPLTLLSARAFKSGNVALTYEAVRR